MIVFLGWFVFGAIIGGIVTIIMMLLSHTIDELKERYLDKCSVVINYDNDTENNKILSLFYGMDESMRICVLNIMTTAQSINVQKETEK